MVVVLLAACLLHLGFTLPTQRETTALHAEYERAAEKRRDVQDRLARIERRAAEYARVSAVLAYAPRGAGDGDPVAELRRSVVENLREVDLSAVRLAVGRGRDPVGATIRVSGRGGLNDVVRFSGCLVQSGGVILEHVRLSPDTTTLGFEISGVRLQGAR